MPAEHLERLTKEELVKIADDFLTTYLQPSFGALPKREVDLDVLELLISIGFISTEPETYELISKLRVTRAKARALLYDRELRRLQADDLNILVKRALQSAKPHKDGDMFVLEVDNPFAIDHLKHLVRQTGHATDGSFSSSLVRLSLPAYVALLEDLMDDDQKAVAEKGLKKAGAPDGSLQGVLRGVFKKLGAKLASEAGETAAEPLGDYVGDLLNKGGAAIGKRFAAVLADKDSE